MCIRDRLIPDIGDFKDVPVIEVLVKTGDEVKAEDSLVTLESDKATIEIPSAYSGLIKEIFVKAGDKVSEGTTVLTIETSDSDHAIAPNQAPDIAPVKNDVATQPEIAAKQAVIQQIQKLPQQNESSVSSTFSKAHASPSIRRFARELGVNLEMCIRDRNCNLILIHRKHKNGWMLWIPSSSIWVESVHIFYWKSLLKKRVAQVLTCPTAPQQPISIQSQPAKKNAHLATMR